MKSYTLICLGRISMSGMTQVLNGIRSRTIFLQLDSSHHLLMAFHYHLFRLTILSNTRMVLLESISRLYNNLECFISMMASAPIYSLTCGRLLESLVQCCGSIQSGTWGFIWCGFTNLPTDLYTHSLFQITDGSNSVNCKCAGYLVTN